MTHKWENPSLPLTPEEQVQQAPQDALMFSGIVPSGEGGSFDHEQMHHHSKPDPKFLAYQKLAGSGINLPYPHPSSDGSLLTDEEFAYRFDSSLSGMDYQNELSPDSKLKGMYTADWWERSGIYNTYPEESVEANERESGIFHFEELDGQFTSDTPVPSGLGDRLKPFKRPSQGATDLSRQGSDFRVMDSYIHHKKWPGVKKAYVEIEFLSTYDVSIDFNRYGPYTANKNAFFDAGYQ